MSPERDQENQGCRAPLIRSILNGPRVRQRSAMEYGPMEFIGQGSYGKVFKFYNKKNGTVVGSHKTINAHNSIQCALKEIRTNITREGIPQHIMREVAILKELSKYDCPNLLKMHSVTHTVDGRDHLTVKLVVDFCEWDLHEFLIRIPKKLPGPQVQMLVQQLFCGLEFLHSHNVTHRDLKPQNILISKDQTLKIADFGLSKYISATSGFTPLVVTLWYRAPEILLQSDYSHASDMWSAGCIIHEMITRKPLFPGHTEAEQLNMILQRIGSPDSRYWPKNAVVRHSSFPKYKSQYEFEFGLAEYLDTYEVIKALLVFNPEKRLSSFIYR